MIQTDWEAKEAVIDTVGDALAGQFGTVQVLDDGLFSVTVELDDGSGCEVQVRVD